MRGRSVRGAGAAALAALALAACGGMETSGRTAREATLLTGGDPARGRVEIRRYGCDACHSIPGVPGADREVGPPLAGLVRRVYIAGVLPNTPANLVKWIRNPPGVDDKTAMPYLGVSERAARDIAAYLYTLK